MPRRAAAVPEGLRYLPDFVTPDEERALLEALAALPLDEVRMHGGIARRRVRHFGLRYGYDSWQLTPADPIPDFLAPLVGRGAAALGVAPSEIAEVLVSRYPPGAGIGWHRDAPMFGPAVLGVSLGGGCRMRFRRRVPDGFEAHAIDLAPRSAYVIAGAARSRWQHSIVDTPGERWSITLRTLASA